MKKFFTKNSPQRGGNFSLIALSISYIAFSIFYYRHLFSYIENIPRSDDFRAILDALILWAENKSATNFFTILFSQHNEHKILIVRFFSILVYELEGSINFKHLTLLGNIFFTSIPLAFLINRKLPLYFYIAVIPLFFSATTYGSSYWAMTSLSNLPVVWFACFAAHFAFHPVRRLNWVAIPMAFLAMFSQGNGMVIFFLLTVYALAKCDKVLKVSYLVIFAIATALFFFNWHKPPNPSPEIALAHPLLAIKFFMSLIGSAAFEPSFAIPLGVILLSGWLTLRVFRPVLGPNDIIVLFILMSAAMTTFNRLIFPASATASKYSIYSLLFLAIVICELAELMQHKKRQWLLYLLLINLSMLYSGYSWYRTSSDRTVFLARMSHLRAKTDGTFTGLYDLRWYLKSSEATLKHCQQLGIYTPAAE